MRLPTVLALSWSGLTVALVPSLARAEEPPETTPAALPAPAPSPAHRASLGPRYYTIATVVPSSGNWDTVDDQETPELPTRSYGWQVVGVDMVAYGSGTAAFLLATTRRAGVPENAPVALAVGAGVSYLMGSPILHLAKGHPDKALKSFGIRVGFAALGALPLAILGGTTCSGIGGGYLPSCGSVTGAVAIAGAVVTSPAATALDATLIAREPVAPARFAWTLAPLVDPRTRSYGASWTGVAW